MVYNIEKMLKEHREKVSASDAKAVEDALDETKKAMSEGGIDKINQATSKLETASHKLAEAMYKSASQPPGGDAAAGAGASGGAQPGQGDAKPKDSKKDDVVDAEFVDVEDKK
jgi:molecular chaperone DnaK